MTLLAIVLVVAGTPIRPELDGGFLEVRDAFPLAAKPLANVPILFLAERGSDGSFFASGHALAALIAARYGLPDMSRPEHGNFGELSLSSSKAGHLPSGIVGVNLARLGWCDQLTLPYENRSGLPLAALHDGRTFYELPIPFPNRGSVLVESRAGSRAEPGLTASGMLIYWQFPETGLEVVLANGKQIAPRFMRLSPVMPGFETPFHEALAMQDLFRTDCDLDELTSPSLATITGEGLWRIHRRSVAAGDKLAVEFAGQDLLKHGEIGFVRDGSTPVPGDSSGAEASAGLDSNVVTLAGAPAGGSSIGVIVAPSAARLGPCRLLAQFKVTTPPTNAEVEVRIGKRSLRCEIGTSQARTFWSELDADGFTPGERVTVTLGPSQGALARIRLEQLWLVPRAPVLATVTTDPANLRAQRLHDGNVYGSVFPMRETSPAQPRLRLPTLWPKGTSWLRLRIGAPWDGPALVTSKLSVRLLARNGTRNVALCSALPWRVDRKGAPLTTLLLQVPSSAQEGVAWLEFDVQGSALQVVSCEILRE